MRKFIIFFAVFLFAGCSFRPELAKVDDKFSATAQSVQISQQWWEEFGDEKLNKLVQDTLANNADLRIAFLNLEKAAATLGISNADLLPSIGLKGGYTKSGNKKGEQDSFSASAFLNYELDLWGRVRNQVASSKALFKASEYDYNASKLSVAAAVVDNYFNLLGLKMKKNVYEQTLKSYEQALIYRKSQLDAGSITPEVYLQSLAAVQNAKIGLSRVSDSLTSVSNALLLLSGRSNDEILSSSVDAPDFLPKVPNLKYEISSDILLRRADVASALEGLKSTNALIGVAKAAYFPTLSLSSAFGYSSTALDRLFIGDASSWSLAGSLAQSVFDHSRRKNSVKIAQIAQSTAAIKYEKTIKQALSEARVALKNSQNAQEILRLSEEFLNSQNEIYSIISAQFDAGYVNHLNLLDAQRGLLNAKLSHVEARLGLNRAALGLFKAFGGGFLRD